MTLTLGHVLLLLAVIAAIAAASNVLRAMRHRGHDRGTPQYAEARLARRKALYALVLALLLGALCLTPLCTVELVGAGA